jgi:8-oxo-dGTP diphosphatase
MSSGIEELLVVAAVIRHGERILAAKRLPGGPAGNRWEFPGGKVEHGESPEVALAREIEEELGLPLDIGPLLGEFTTVQASKAIRLRCYWGTVAPGKVALRAHSEVRWCTKPELESLEWADPDIPAVQQLMKLLLGS